MKKTPCRRLKARFGAVFDSLMNQQAVKIPFMTNTCAESSGLAAGFELPAVATAALWSTGAARTGAMARQTA